MLNRKIHKKLDKLIPTDEYAKALQTAMPNRVLHVEPHHKRLYGLFLSNAFGELESKLRAQRTMRLGFQVTLEETQVTFKFSRVDLQTYDYK